MTKSLKRGLILSFILLLFFSLFASISIFKVMAYKEYLFDLTYFNTSDRTIIGGGNLKTYNNEEVDTSILLESNKINITNDVSGKYLIGFLDIQFPSDYTYLFIEFTNFRLCITSNSYFYIFAPSTSQCIHEKIDEPIFCFELPTNAGCIIDTYYDNDPYKTDQLAADIDSINFYVFESNPFEKTDMNASADENSESDNFLDEISAWLETNTGIAVSSGGIVVIGVIILLLIFTKRR